MNELIKYFNENYGKDYGKISYPRTTLQIYQTYQIIKDCNLKDEKLLKLLDDVKLPRPKTIEEREMYSECLYEVSGNEFGGDVLDIKEKKCLYKNILSVEDADYEQGSASYNFSMDATFGLNVNSSYHIILNEETLSNLVHLDEKVLAITSENEAFMAEMAIFENKMMLSIGLPNEVDIINFSLWENDECIFRTQLLSQDSLETTFTKDKYTFEINENFNINNYSSYYFVINNELHKDEYRIINERIEFSSEDMKAFFSNSTISIEKNNINNYINIELWEDEEKSIKNSYLNKDVVIKRGLSIGKNALAMNDYSFAQGIDVSASGKNSHAEGDNTTASGKSSHAEGYGTTASGGYSHAEGFCTTASGTDSHAEGYETTASKDYSHAEGDNTTASGYCSHAEGSYTKASGFISHAEGKTTIASSDYQHVQGKFNIVDTSNKYAHIVGNGTKNNKSNAHTLDWNGNAWFAGKLSQEGTPTDSKDLITKKYFDSNIPKSSDLTDYAKKTDLPKKASDVGADATGTAASKVNEHNTSASSHSDMRSLITNLTTKLNTLADSDDTTLDQLSEIVAYIKNNKSLIDGITTSKLNISDVADNLTTNIANKVLSAKQGVELKKLIDAITVPTKVSQLTNDSKFLTSVPAEYITEDELNTKGYLTKHQDISGKVDKVEGKGLSTVDFTTTYETKLKGLSNYNDTIIKNDIDAINTKINTMFKFNDNGELVVTIGGVSKTFVPKSE